MCPSPFPSPEPTLLPSEDDVPGLCAAAVALLEQGEVARAIATLQRALVIEPHLSAGWLELGNAHLQQECVPEAIAAYERAICLDPSLSEAHLNLAMALREQGNSEAAIAAYRAGLALDPTDTEALLDLGLLLQGQERWQEAFEAFQRAQALTPSPALQAKLGDLLVRQGDLEGATSHYRRALASWAAADGEDLQAQILDRLGVALHQQCHLDDAIQAYGEALKLRPAEEATNTHRNAALEQLKGAVRHLRHTLHNLPASDHASRAGLLTKLGVALQQAGCLEEAIATYGQALALDPELESVKALRLVATEQRQDPTALLAIALRLNLLALFEEEALTLQQAAALAPDHQPIQQERALSLLRLGRFEEGWPLYAWRGEPVCRSAPLPRWRSGMSCHRLLLLPEQGLGDQIMFASILPDAAALAPQLTLIADPRLRALLARSFPHLEVVPRDQPFHTAHCQAQLPLGSLGGLFRLSKAHFLSSRRAYLVADPAKTQALRRRHHPNQAGGQAWGHGQGDCGKLLVGIAWSSASTGNGFMKSIALESLAGALALPGVHLLSLQYGDTRAERDALRRATGLEVFADPEIDTFHDIDNLAALIAACDLVVSVSNTIAHLAGALGRPTWLLIDSRLDWRWGLTDSETYWYPNARLFRQTAAGNWVTPLRAIQAELRSLRERGAPWQGPGFQGPGGGQPMWCADMNLRDGAVQPPGKWVF